MTKFRKYFHEATDCFVVFEAENLEEAEEKSKNWRIDNIEPLHFDKCENTSKVEEVPDWEGEIEEPYRV